MIQPKPHTPTTSHSTSDIFHDTDAVAQTVAHWLQERGWQASASIILEMGRPFAFLSGQLLWVAQPTLSLFMPSQQISNLAHILETPNGVDLLIDYLTDTQNHLGREDL